MADADDFVVVLLRLVLLGVVAGARLPDPHGCVSAVSGFGLARNAVGGSGVAGPQVAATHKEIRSERGEETLLSKQNEQAVAGVVFLHGGWDLLAGDGEDLCGLLEARDLLCSALVPGSDTQQP
eukprot:4396499-Pyramimonas_sp.AAC.2